jgi:hypothetical protein
MTIPKDWRRLLMAFCLGTNLVHSLPKALEKGSMGGIVVLSAVSLFTLWVLLRKGGEA